MSGEGGCGGRREWKGELGRSIVFVYNSGKSVWIIFLGNSYGCGIWNVAFVALV